MSAVDIACIWALAGSSLLTAPPGAKERPWSLAPLVRPAVPEVRNRSWIRNPIDAFVLAKLEDSGLTPSPEASRSELLRRAYLDLAGLLPEPADVETFAADDSSEGFERRVDRLLASPQYGERWARHWLDLARYAESEGFKSDETRPNAWRYRDYVIRSLNSDKPYDRFVREQIAGDELWPEDPEAHVATAFNRHYPDESNARNLLQRRQEILNDITDTTAQVFTGLTFGCARCHDHKYDPITQEDYYRLQAFFANVRAVDDIPLLRDEELRRHRAKMAIWEEKTASIRAQMAAIEEPRRKDLAKDNFDRFPEEIQNAISKPASDRTPIEWQMYYKALPYLNPDLGSIVGGLKEEAKKRWQALSDQRSNFAELHPGVMPIGTGIGDGGRVAPKTYVLPGGLYNAADREVDPGFPSAYSSEAPRIFPPPGIESSGRRTALANWLADARNPTTARVIANRVWHYHFGRGIAGSPNDLGHLGDRPTHPGLLDWLATELVSSGWSLKRLHRLILTSSVYRQSSMGSTPPASDPENMLLWRFPRFRLEGEVIRDIAMQAAGILNLEAGGPSILPELPQGTDGHARWSLTTDSFERRRRSIYVFVKRNLRYPFFEAFDMPDTHETCGRRNVTTTAPQALLLLNDALTLEWAAAFASRARAAATESLESQVEESYRIAYARRPGAEEKAEAAAFLKRQAEIAGGAQKALVDLCHVLLNSSEFIYRN